MILLLILGSVALIAAGGLVAVYRIAHMFVHPRRVPVTETPADYDLEYETLTLATRDGYRLAAWYMPARNRAAVIVQHGYPNNRGAELYAARALVRHGYGVIMVDLRGQGESEGDTVSFGLREVHDVDAAYRHLLTRPEVDPQRIGAVGNSLGGVVVLLYATQNAQIKAVVAQAAFASLDDEVATGVKAITGLPAFPFAALVCWFAERAAKFDSKQIAPIDAIAKISPRPVFLMQGGADTLIPIDSGQRLYEAAGEPRQLWFEPQVGHGGFGHARAEEYEARVVAFFDRYLLERAGERVSG
jgi:uncharacterized protein